MHEEFGAGYDPATESLDDLLIGGLKYIQALQGYRFSIDSVLLAHFARPGPAPLIYDLGTGNGVIALLLSWRYPDIPVRAVEIQPAMAERARRNVTLNCRTEQIQVVEGDLKEIRLFLPPAEGGLVVFNPPFFRLGQGKISAHPEISGARHEIHAQLEDMVNGAAYLLNRLGRLAFIVPPSRLQESLALCAGKGLRLARLRPVYSRSGGDAVMILVECIREGRQAALVENPLYIYGEDGAYTREIMALYGG